MVHLQLLVALTAQRLCALNLQTVQWGANEEQGRSPQDAQPRSPTPPQLVTAASGHQPTPLLLRTNLRGDPPPRSHPHPTPGRTPALTFAGEAVGGDPRERFSAHVAEGGAGVGAGVPVVHSREVLHVELRGLLGHSPAPSVPWDPPNCHSLPPTHRESPQPHSHSCPPLRGCAKGSSSCPAAKGTPAPEGCPFAEKHSRLPTSPHGSPTSGQISGH